MSPRPIAFTALLALTLTACAESPAPSEPVTVAAQRVETPLDVQRLYKVFAPGEVTFEDLDARRKTLDRTYIAAGPRSTTFETCIRNAGLSDHVMAQCDYDEAERLAQDLNALLSAVTRNPEATPANAQSDWERETVEGCAWSPSEEGNAGELNAEACVTNRLENRVAELSGDALPTMCRMLSPADVLQEWAEVPDVRLGRVSAALAATVTPEERLADPAFDGFRLGTLDYEWVYVEPTRPSDEQRPVRLELGSTPSGFTVTIQPGLNGDLIDASGPHNEPEFLPDSGPPIVYTFVRLDDCWVLVSATGPAQGA